jgi:hypothetical protein
VGCFPGYVRALFDAGYHGRLFQKTIVIFWCSVYDSASEVLETRHFVIVVASEVGSTVSRTVFGAMAAVERMCSAHRGRIEDGGVFVDG